MCLFVSAISGGVFTYLAKLPLLGDAAGTRLAYLTSLLEVRIDIVVLYSVTWQPNFDKQISSHEKGDGILGVEQ